MRIESTAVPARILIVDDHESVRMGLRFLLSKERQFEVVGEASSVSTAIHALDALLPHIVVLDFALGSEHAGAILDSLAGRANAPRVMMLSMEDERVVGREMIRRGVAAFVAKHASGAVILQTLRQIHASLGCASEMPAPDATGLTHRERDVLRLLRTSLASKEIARRLCISEKTVDVHKHRIRRKLGLHSDWELARYAAMFGAPA
jgi:two-component system nitrate/nitrite response regulator NarL